jgi:toxin FitB
LPKAPDRAVVAVDTSVAIPLVVQDHDQHAATTKQVRNLPLALAGHAAFETFSVLTRLPAPARRTPASIARLLADRFPHPCFLSGDECSEVLAALPELGVGGASVYDALVASAAKARGLRLLTRDQRALEVYRTVGAEAGLVR